MEDEVSQYLITSFTLVSQVVVSLSQHSFYQREENGQELFQMIFPDL